MPSRFEQSGHVDFTGGLNTRLDESTLPPNSFSEFRNVTLYNRTLQKRLGSTKQASVGQIRSTQFNGSDQYIQIPHHLDYNSYHLDSSDDGASFYLETQCNFDYADVLLSPQPIIFKKHSFLLYLDTDKHLKLRWIDRGSDLQGESLNNGSFTGSTDWILTSNYAVDLANRLSYISAASDTSTATQSNLAIVGKPNTEYVFQYEVIGATTGTATTKLTTSFCSSEVIIDTSSTGVFSVIFTSNSSPGAFVLSTTSVGAASFKLDNFSLKSYTSVISPYDLSSLHPMSSSDYVNLGLQFSNLTPKGITLWANGMLISDQDESGTGILNEHLWDDYDDTGTSKIYLGYYDGVDYASTGLSAELFYTGYMREFRLWRTDISHNGELARSNSDKKRYCFGTLPTSETIQAFLKAHFKLDDIGGSVVVDSDSNTNNGNFVGATRTSSLNDSMNARGVYQFRRQLSGNLSIIDAGQSIFEDMGTNEFIRVYQRDPSRILSDDGVTVTYESLPEAETYNDRLYFAVGEENPIKHTGTHVYEVGIDPPSSSPTGNSSSSGLLTGAYKWVSTYYNSVESIESSVSGIYSTTLSSNQIWLNLKRPVDRQVDKIRVYRTKAGGTVYFLVEEIDAWTSYYWNSNDIVWQDNTIDSNLQSSVAPTLNATPPQAKYIAEHHDRLFLAGDPTNPSRLYYSESAKVEYFPASNKIDIGSTSEGDITGINYARGRLYIFKEKATWYLYGTSPQNFYTDYISREIGCTAPHSRVVVGDIIIFASSDGVYMIEGTSGKISNISEQIKPTYLGLNHSVSDKWIAVHNRKFSQYILCCASSGSSINDIALVYDYSSGGWSIWDLYADSAYSFFESNQDEVYSINDANGTSTVTLFKQNTGHNDGVSTNLPYGQPTLFGSDWIDDSLRLYPFTDNDLIGCPIFLVNYDGGDIQKRIIISNVGSRITVNSPFSPSLSSAHYYFVGGINLQCITGWMDAGAVQNKKRFQSIDILFDPTSTSTITNGSRSIITQPLEPVFLGSAVDYESTFSKIRRMSISSSDGHHRWSISRRGRYLKLKIVSVAPNTPVNINKIIYGTEYRGIR